MGSIDGKDLAIEREDSRKQELFLKFFLHYPPYGHLLESLSHTNTLSITETESIKDYWWKHGYGSSGNNREDGVVAFGKLIQLAGLGKFLTGRRGKPSRIEWNPNAKALIDKACIPNEDIPDLEEQFEIPLFSQKYTNDTVSTTGNVSDDSKEDPVDPKIYTEKSSFSRVIQPSTTLNVIPNIAISVDMSEWDNSKIITFFKAAYGIFENDGETDVSTSCSQSIGEPSDECSAS